MLSMESGQTKSKLCEMLSRLKNYSEARRDIRNVESYVSKESHPSFTLIQRPSYDRLRNHQGLGSSSSRVTTLGSWARYFTLSARHTDPEYKWLMANCRSTIGSDNSCHFLNQSYLKLIPTAICSLEFFRSSNSLLFYFKISSPVCYSFF